MPSTNTERSKALSAANSKALQRLKEAHIDEFNTLMVQEAKDRGEKWEPRKTEEQRAAEEVAELLARFPQIRKEFQPVATEGEVDIDFPEQYRQQPVVG